MSPPTALKMLLSAAAIAALGMPQAVAAQTTSSGLETLGSRVSDAELGQMRGKFISADKISYFGVQMQTSWQSSDGITTAATLLFSVEFLNGAGNATGATPVLLVGWTRDGDSSLDVSAFQGAAADGYVTIPISGLGSTHGTVQTQQIAGSDNRTLNEMQIAILPISSVTSPSGDGLTQITSTEGHQFADGDTIQFVLGSNQVGLVLSGAEDADHVRQAFDGTIGQAAQHMLLSTSGNAIRNSMQIVIGHEQLNQASRIELQNALSTLRGIGF